MNKDTFTRTNIPTRNGRINAIHTELLGGIIDFGCEQWFAGCVVDQQRSMFIIRYPFFMCWRIPFFPIVISSTSWG